MRFCLIIGRKERASYVSLLELLPSEPLGHRANPVIWLPCSIREELHNSMGVSCDRLLRGWSTESAPLVSEKNRRFRDQLMCLKDAGLLSGKAKNSD